MSKTMACLLQRRAFAFPNGLRGKALYVDDLICLESHRGKGFAEALMAWMEGLARKEGCGEFHLDSGTHRLGAHRFYHRLKLVIASFHSQEKL